MEMEVFTSRMHFAWRLSSVPQNAPPGFRVALSPRAHDALQTVLHEPSLIHHYLKVYIRYMVYMDVIHVCLWYV